jgi:hypothetical protein
LQSANRGLRIVWLTLFAIAAGAVLGMGWRGGEPLTAAAFVVFFASRVVRSVIKRPLVLSGVDDPPRRARQFLVVTVAGWMSAGLLAGIAALVGEGQEWLYVAPGFILMGVLNLVVLLTFERKA